MRVKLLSKIMHHTIKVGSSLLSAGKKVIVKIHVEYGGWL